MRNLDRLRRTSCLLTLAGLGACSSVQTADPAAPAELERALDAWLGPEIEGPVYYFAGESDLDGDGLGETVVYVAGPMVCGSGGCTTLVFANRRDGLALISEIAVSRPPVRAARSSNNGWRDLVVHVAGGGVGAPYDARLRFDGSRYAPNPTVAPAEKLSGDMPGETIIGAFGNLTDGVQLR